MTDLRKVALKFKSKLDCIKVVAFDIDGVLTDGTMRYEGKEMEWNRTYNVRDGYGIMMLREAGFKVGIISAGASQSVIQRFENRIKVDYLHLGKIDKREGYRSILEDGYEDEEILYMGGFIGDTETSPP